MKKFFTFLFAVPVFLCFNAWGQDITAPGLFNFEIYGGPSKSHFDVDIQNAENGMSLFSPVDAHMGINVLTRVTDVWQVSLQGEYLRRPVGSKETYNGRTTSRRSTSFDKEFANYSIGARYNLYKGKKAFFFQPSVGLAVNKVHQWAFGGGSISTNTTLTLRTEAGVKFYNRRNNYFVVGIRHQQGMNSFDKQFHAGTGPGSLSLDFRSKGSFTGLFVGYGINTGRKNR